MKAVAPWSLAALGLAFLSSTSTNQHVVHGLPLSKSNNDNKDKDMDSHRMGQGRRPRGGRRRLKIEDESGKGGKGSRCKLNKKDVEEFDASCPPSEAPSETPSGIPTITPGPTLSAAPSWSPSVVPSDLPSQVPSDAPSSFPTMLPTEEPSPIPTPSVAVGTTNEGTPLVQCVHAFPAGSPSPVSDSFAWMYYVHAQPSFVVTQSLLDDLEGQLLEGLAAASILDCVYNPQAATDQQLVGLDAASPDRVAAAGVCKAEIATTVAGETCTVVDATTGTTVVSTNVARRMRRLATDPAIVAILVPHITSILASLSTTSYRLEFAELGSTADSTGNDANPLVRSAIEGENNGADATGTTLIAVVVAVAGLVLLLLMVLVVHQRRKRRAKEIQYMEHWEDDDEDDIISKEPTIAYVTNELSFQDHDDNDNDEGNNLDMLVDLQEANFSTARNHDVRTCASATCQLCQSQQQQQQPIFFDVQAHSERIQADFGPSRPSRTYGVVADAGDPIEDTQFL